MADPKAVINIGEMGSRGRGMNSDQIAEKLIRKFKATVIRVDGVSVPVCRGGPQRPKKVAVRVRKFGENHRVLFKMLDGDLYVVAFRRDEQAQPQPPLYELARRERGQNVPGGLFEGSIQLGLNGSYSSAQGIGSLSGSYRDTLILNRYNTAKHLRFLHFYDPNVHPLGELAEALVYKVHLLAELPRFNDIQRHVRPQWFKNKTKDLMGKDMAFGRPLGSTISGRENDWQTISYQLQKEGNKDFSGNSKKETRVAI